MADPELGAWMGRTGPRGLDPQVPERRFRCGPSPQTGRPARCGPRMANEMPRLVSCFGMASVMDAILIFR